jgi:hypothetical protein
MLYPNDEGPLPVRPSVAYAPVLPTYYDDEIKDVRGRNPVNAGLLAAANELESAQEAKIKADRRYTAAVKAFGERYAK